MEDGFVTASAFGLMHKKSKQWVCEMLREGRIAGAYKLGRDWHVPIDAKCPAPLPHGPVPSVLSSRAQRRLEVAAKREKARQDEELALAKIKTVPRKSAREDWWVDILNQGYEPFAGRWIQQFNEIEGPGWAEDETEEEFKARCAQWRDWYADGQPDEGMPEDFRAYCASQQKG